MSPGGAQDEAAFSALVAAHRYELRAHCYRMLRSVEDAEDLVQETFLRAWRSRGTYQGRSSRRVWLYRIATNACHDALARRHRPQRALRAEAAAAPRATPEQAPEPPAPPEGEPDAVLIGKETLELLLLAAIRLPARQAGALILRCVAGLSANETAVALDASVPAVNSALQRARRTLRDQLPEQRLAWRGETGPIEEERAVIRQLIEGMERADDRILVALSLRRWALATGGDAA